MKAGQEGENLAVQWLESQGFRILKRNFRSSRGEVDIIGEKDKILHFVEVKHWKTLEKDTMELAISPRKIVKILHAARNFLWSHQEWNDSLTSFDVLFLQDSTKAPEFWVGAFDETGYR